MPKPRGKKPVHLTKVKKKGREGKEHVIADVKEAVKKYQHSYVLAYHNVSTNSLNKLRMEFWDSRMFLGKNKLIAFALKQIQDEDPSETVHVLGHYMSGECLLLCTDWTDVKAYFKEFSVPAFAKGGEIAKEDVILKAGSDVFEDFSFSLEPHLRELNIPTQLKNQKIALLEDVQLAAEGEPMNVEQCKVLKLIGKRMSEFWLWILARYNRESKNVKAYEEIKQN